MFRVTLTVLMDGELQDPPEAIPTLVDDINEDMMSFMSSA